MSRPAVVVGCLIAACLAGGAAEAAAVKPDHRFEFVLGGFLPSLDTRIRLDAGDILGTTLDFETALGLDDSDTLPIGGIGFRMGRRHRLNLAFFRLERTGFSNTVDIRFGDLEISVPTDVNTFFNSDVYTLFYGFSIVARERATFGLAAGINVQDISAGVATADGTRFEEGQVTAPLPTFGIFGGYDFTRKLGFDGDITVFGLKVEEFEGSIVNASVRLSHQTFKHIGFGVAYTLFEVDIDSEIEDFKGSFEYLYQGPMIYLRGRF